MKNTPFLETERLYLRRFSKKDAPALFEIMSDPEVNTFLPWLPFQKLSEAERHLEDYYLRYYEQPVGYRYAVCLKEDNLPIGYVHLSLDDSHDFGYGLRKEFWRQGIAAEASRTIAAQIQRDGFSYITATHDVQNPYSGAVMRKIGMTYQYSYEELWQPKNKLVTFRMYQLNFDPQDLWVFRAYWEKYAVHYVEDLGQS